ncbi:hypothetical protein BDQ17DRAFT_1385687 [Cyathus striatus]|nr:hypothetical protein BDQ17DRAFT_1385687 [Cyathus striatus]
MSAGSLGSAAAMQVLKQFVSGSGSKGSGAASGNKQDAVNGAAMTVMKLLVQSKFSGGTIGGSNSGGLSGLLGLASQFTK